MEARVGVPGHGGVVDSGARKFLPQHHHQPQQPKQPPLHPQSQIGTLPQLLAGGVAGAFSKTCTAPLARLTILFQVQGMHSDVAVMSKPSILREALRIVNEEGFRAFWKGNLVTIAHRLPYSSVNFYAYERYKIVGLDCNSSHSQVKKSVSQNISIVQLNDILPPDFVISVQLLKSIPGLDSHGGNAGADIFVHFTGGGLAGITAASATYPLDLVRTRLAAQRNTTYYRGIWHALSTICRDEGFFGLYKGLGATLLGVGPSIAISFSVYETLRSFWRSQRPDDSTAVVSLTCGSLSGIASSTATFPLDLVRRRMQLEGVAGRARVYNTGLFGTFRHIIRSEGFRGLYRGIIPEYYKVVPSVGIVFMTYETLKKLLSGGPFNS